MKIHLLENRAPFGWTTFGGYWPEGAVRTDRFTLKNDLGQAVPLQSDITARWGDGSVRWSRHTASADALGPGGELTADPETAGKTVHDAPAKQPGLSATETAEGWRIAGNRLNVFIPKEGDLLARDATFDGVRLFSSAYPVLSLAHETEESGRITRETVPCPARILRREAEESGPLQVTIRFDGVHLEGEREVMPFRLRMTLHDDGQIGFDHTFFFRGDPGGNGTLRPALAAADPSDDGPGNRS